MEEENRKQTLQIAKELNTLGNQLRVNVSELLNEVDAYTEKYFDQVFFPSEIENDKDGTKTRNEIKKGETYFDKVHESVLRNDIINQLQNTVEMILNKFLEKMKQFKNGITEDNERLINSNNEIIENLLKLEKKLMKKSLKNSFHEDEKKHLSDSFKNNLMKNINPFNRKTSKQIQHENEQRKSLK